MRKVEGCSPLTRNAEAEAQWHARTQVSMVAEWLQIGGVSFADNNSPQRPCIFQYKPLDVESKN